MAQKRLQAINRPASPMLAGFFNMALLAWASFAPALSFGQPLDGDAILAQVKATYPALTSYSDRVTMVTESQYPGSPLLREHHSFTTAFRAPRTFLLIFDQDPQAGGDRYVLRSDENAIYSWWKATGVTETYPPGVGLSAFGVSAYPTRSAVLQILPLIFADYGLSGPITDVSSAILEGEEDIEGHACYRLQGVGRSAYGTGGGETFRPTTLWIDKDSFLVRRLFQDTQQGSTSGMVDRQTTTFDPLANPDLGADAFEFTPPGPAQ